MNAEQREGLNPEIVFTGLCSILNPDGKHRDMGDPAVILVQTDHDHGSHEQDHSKRGSENENATAPPKQEEQEEHEEHIAFLAFNSAYVEFSGAGEVTPVRKGAPFVYLRLDQCVELRIEDNTEGPPCVSRTYRELVAHRDEYWPEVIGAFDEAYVPKRDARPKAHAVKAWMRLGGGRISASRVSEAPWRFVSESGKVLKEDEFAEEVVYSGFGENSDTVVIQLLDLETGKTDLGRWSFSLKPEAPPNARLTLIIGNGLEGDMANDVWRVPTKSVRAPDADHFKFLNRVAGSGDGPKLKVINPPPDTIKGGGGGSGGACGPGSANGR